MNITIDDPTPKNASDVSSAYSNGYDAGYAQYPVDNPPTTMPPDVLVSITNFTSSAKAFGWAIDEDLNLIGTTVTIPTGETRTVRRTDAPGGFALGVYFGGVIADNLFFSTVRVLGGVATAQNTSGAGVSYEQFDGVKAVVITPMST